MNMDQDEWKWVYKYFASYRAKVRIAGRTWIDEYWVDGIWQKPAGISFSVLRGGARLLYKYIVNRS